MILFIVAVSTFSLGSAAVLYNVSIAQMLAGEMQRTSLAVVKAPRPLAVDGGGGGGGGEGGTDTAVEVPIKGGLLCGGRALRGVGRPTACETSQLGTLIHTRARLTCCPPWSIAWPLKYVGKVMAKALSISFARLCGSPCRA